MSQLGFAFPTLPPPPRGHRRRWGAQVLAAACVGTTIGALYFAVAADPSSSVPSWQPGVDRRPAQARCAEARSWPLQWLSSTHVAVDVASEVRGASSHLSPVRVALDTGCSHPVVTDHGVERLGLARGVEPERAISSFSGSTASAFGLSEPLLLDATSCPWDVAAPVWHYVRGKLYDVDVIASPVELAPRGGAVLLDLVGNRLLRCESADRCLEGRGWSELRTVVCPDTGGLFAVRVELAGQARTLMLDTGSPTVLSSSILAAAEFQQGVRRARAGSLVGAASASEAVRVEGHWPVRFGSPSAGRHLQSVWVLKEGRQGPLARCFPDGTAGLDAFSACALMIEDAPVPRVLVRCDGPSARAPAPAPPAPAPAQG